MKIANDIPPFSSTNDCQIRRFDLRERLLSRCGCSWNRKVEEKWMNQEEFSPENMVCNL